MKCQNFFYVRSRPAREPGIVRPVVNHASADREAGRLNGYSSGTPTTLDAVVRTGRRRCEPMIAHPTPCCAPWMTLTRALIAANLAGLTTPTEQDLVDGD
jgi:hypothetical protein